MSNFESHAQATAWRGPVALQPELDIHNLLTVEDVAKLLKVSKSWVYEHTRVRGTPCSERIPHIRIGKYLRFDERAVRTFLTRKASSF